MKPLTRTGAGTSSNMAYYAEPYAEINRIFAEVIRQDMKRLKGTNRLVRMERPTFSLRVYREGASGRIAERKYRPRNPVPDGPLDAATVTRLVRLALKGPRGLT